jgi:hypothetical protein
MISERFGIAVEAVGEELCAGDNCRLDARQRSAAIRAILMKVMSVLFQMFAAKYRLLP